MRNEKLGKVTKFGDPRLIIKWAVYENIRGRGDYPSSTPPSPPPTVTGLN